VVEGSNLLLTRVKGNKLKGKEKNPNQVEVVLSMVDYIIQENV
jgi:hypothetical protein